jgi:hypothetical protein
MILPKKLRRCFRGYSTDIEPLALAKGFRKRPKGLIIKSGGEWTVERK